MAEESESQTPSPPPPNSETPSPPPPNSETPSPPPPNSETPSPPPPNSDNNNNGGNNGNNNGGDNNNDANNNSDGNNNNNKGGNNNNDGNNNNGNNKNDNNNNNGNNNKDKNSGSPSPPSPHSPPNSWNRGRLPPPPPRSHGKSSSHSSNNSDEQAILIGVCVGVGLLLIFILACIICCCCRKKKKRRPHDQMHYYNHDSFENGSSEFFPSGPQHGNWNMANHGQNTVKPPQQPASNVSSAEYPALAPPPPPPMMYSSDTGSTGFSGAAPYSGMGPHSGMGSSGFSGPNQSPLPPPHPTLALGFNKSSFTYEDLSAATGGFAKDNLLGQGGFGYVHKGVLPNGKEIAVKSLKSGSGQGEREFQAEVEIISRVHHRHLVSLVGYCIANTQRMLVYEFVPNDSLEHHLHGKGQPVMDAETRLKIALGSAKGFAYLHEDCHPRIIHRDIKGANILLDNNFEAKVADFGLAKLSNDNNTHVSTRIMGTFGYLAPEYASTGKLTEKSDVYSYGVVLLELITGKRPVDVHSEDDSLVDWARPLLMQATQGGSFEELIDPLLENKYNPQEMLRMVACAGACIRHSARRRPKMSQIVRALEGDASLDDLNDAIKTSGSNSNFASNGSEYDSREIKKVRTSGVSSQEFSSSGEQGLTGEFK